VYLYWHDLSVFSDVQSCAAVITQFYSGVENNLSTEHDVRSLQKEVTETFRIARDEINAKWIYLYERGDY